MNILYYDCSAGISGDMNLAAMIDLGVAPDELRAALSTLGLDDEFELMVSEDVRGGIRGTRVDVRCPAGDAPHRTLADVEALLDRSGLVAEVRETARRIFRRLAEAEGRVHGVPAAAVHFHEVGAVDAVVDIVGAAVCRRLLGVDAVWASPVELGGGFVRCAHGELPVPAPATEELLHGAPTTRGGTPHEATTPTGAAILTTLADAFPSTPAMAVRRTGCGIGHRETARPNVLRVHLATADELRPAAPARMLQCNIDDMTGELLGDVLALLLEQGAMDVHFTPIFMKKNRPATQLSLLCAEADAGRFTELLFRHTTTLGVKSFRLEKTELERRFRRVETPLGPVRVKEALLHGAVLRAKPEFEDCRELSRRHGLPLAEVYELVRRADGEPE